MRALIAAAALLGLALLPATPAFAEKVVKTPVCHYSIDEDQYVYLLIPAKQLAKGAGHATHTADVLGLTKDECLALNTPV